MNGISEETQRSGFFDGLYSYKAYRPFAKASERKAWEKLNAKYKEALVKEAEKYLGFEWQEIRATELLAYVRDGERKGTDKINGKRKALLSLTLAECAVYDGTFIDDITDGLWSICEETSWAAAAHIDTCGGTFDGLPRTEEEILDLAACETAQLIAFVYYMLYEKLSEQSVVITERIREEIYRRIIKPYLNRNDYWWIGKMGRRLNNWNPWCNSNVLFSMLCTEQNDDIRRRVLEKAVKSLDVFLSQYPEDGSCDEGTSYWFKSGGKLINALEILNSASANKLKIKNIEKTENCGLFIVRSRFCGNYYQNFADGSAKINEPDAFAIYNMGKLFDNKIFLKEGRFLRKYIVNEASAENFAAWEIMRRINYYDEISLGSSEPESCKSTYFAGTQNMISRETDRENRGLILAVKGGTNIESHNHNDIGNFMVYNDGRPVIIDVGVGTYTRDTFNENRYTIWTMQSLYHNLPMIDGKGEHEGEEYFAENVSHTFTEERDIFSLSLNKAYENDCKLENWIRSAELNRKEKAISVTDDFKLGKKSSVEFVLMLIEKPVTDGNVIESGNCRIEVIADKETEIFCEDIEITDKKLIGEWGKFIYRVHIKITEKTDRGNVKIKITSMVS